MRNGETVAAFERELASYCGAKFCVSASNGTVTLSAALVALGVKPGDRVATTPLTHAATSIAILNVGAVPVYRDVDPATWIMQDGGPDASAWLPVALYGLHGPLAGPKVIEDAAQTLRKHDGAAFTSLSFQASKILSTGEGGALLTNDEQLAERARSYLSLGYRMSATQARIDSATLKSPTFDRHHAYPAINGRMNDVTAAEGLRAFDTLTVDYGDEGGAYLVFSNGLNGRREVRRRCAEMYRDAIAGCAWLTPQHVPQGHTHDYWAFAVACDTPERAVWLQQRMGELGAEIPYGAWRLSYAEPALRHLNPPDVRYHCPNAESLQPRILAFQTNHLASAEQNARALRRAIQEAA